jgi:hypothetical protein
MFLHPYTPTGFEPELSALWGDAMTTASVFISKVSRYSGAIPGSFGFTFISFFSL